MKGSQEKTGPAHTFTRTFEEVEIGETIWTEPRTVTLDDIEHFAHFTGDTFYGHMDEEAAKANPFFPGRVAHGYLILSFAAGLFVEPNPGPVLANTGPVLWLLAAVIGFEYLGVGMGTAAFTAFIARETSKLYAATQFALFTALAALPRTFANATTGIIVERIGWTEFFLLCAVLAIPGMLLLFWVAPWGRGEQRQEAMA